MANFGMKLLGRNQISLSPNISNFLPGIELQFWLTECIEYLLNLEYTHIQKCTKSSTVKYQNGQNLLKVQRSCLFLYCYFCKLFFIPVEQVCQIYQKYIPLYEHFTDKNKTKLVQMSRTAYVVYTIYLSLHHANFAQVKAKQVLSMLCKHIYWLVSWLAGQMTGCMHFFSA